MENKRKVTFEVKWETMRPNLQGYDDDLAYQEYYSVQRDKRWEGGVSG